MSAREFGGGGGLNISSVSHPSSLARFSLYFERASKLSWSKQCLKSSQKLVEETLTL